MLPLILLLLLRSPCQLSWLLVWLICWGMCCALLFLCLCLSCSYHYLLSDDVQGSSPKSDTDAPILRLPALPVLVVEFLYLLFDLLTPPPPWFDSAILHVGLILTEPADVTMRVMQPELMEEHLVALGMYKNLPLLGCISFPFVQLFPELFMFSCSVRIVLSYRPISLLIHLICPGTILSLMWPSCIILRLWHISAYCYFLPPLKCL